MREAPPMMMRACNGALFDPFDPRDDVMTPEVIAHATSQICRFGGHCSTFYSVARHSILVATALLEETSSLELARWGLMHDAAEAFLTDLPTPIKIHWRHYQGTEARILQRLAERYGLPWPIPPQVFEADRAMLAAEMAALMIHQANMRPRLPYTGAGKYARFAPIETHPPAIDRADWLDLHATLFGEGA